MNTGDMLVRAVLENPADDTVRLAFADYLEENGRGLHARFVRDQIAGVVRMVPLSMLVPLEPLTGVMSHQTTRHATAGGCVVTCDHMELVYRRGFVDEVRLPAAAFTEDFARELFARHPVTRVVLTDKQPHETGRPVTDNEYPGWMWCCDPTMALATDQWGIPRYLFDQLADSILMTFGTEWGARPSKFYAAADDGLAALSDACVAWGRSLAGLPPLPHASGGA